jgi:hypothetical protein
MWLLPSRATVLLKESVQRFWVLISAVHMMHRDNQCCGSGSGLEPNLMGSLDPYLDSQSGFGSRRAKMTHKHRKKLINFFFWSAWCSLLRAEGFSCSLDISKLQFLIKTRFKNFLLYFFSSVFGHQNPGSGSGFTWNAGSGSEFNDSGSTSLEIVLTYGPDVHV